MDVLLYLIFFTSSIYRAKGCDFPDDMFEGHLYWVQSLSLTSRYYVQILTWKPFPKITLQGEGNNLPKVISFKESD